MLQPCDVVLAMLRQEAAWVMADTPAHWMPASDTDPLWLTSTDVYDALWSRWQTAPERGRVQLWPEEAEQLTVADLPHAVRVGLDTLAGPRWLHRGGGAVPLVFRADLGSPRSSGGAASTSTRTTSW